MADPVDHDYLYFIHRCLDLIESSEKIRQNIFYGGDFAQATAAIEQGKISNNDIRILIGNCGWDAGNLESEIKARGWSLTESNLFD